MDSGNARKFCSLGGNGASPCCLAHWTPEAKLHRPGVSRTALGVAQPRTGRYAYLNCRRRLKKTNANASPVSGRRQLPVVHVMTRISSPVWQAFGHDTRPPKLCLRTRNASGCASEETECGVLDWRKTRFTRLPSITNRVLKTDNSRTSLAAKSTDTNQRLARANRG
jgi:hypothetical protein